MGKKYYVRDLKKEHPDMPANCLRCALFKDADTYKTEYSLIYSTADVNAVRVLFVVSPARVRGFDLMEYLDGCIKEYFYDCNVYLTYAAKCFPFKDRSVKIMASHLQECSTFLKEDVDNINPDFIILCGAASRQGFGNIKDLLDNIGEE